MQKWTKIIYLENDLWAENGPLKRSAELTPLYVDRYRGPRANTPTTHTFWELTCIIAGDGILECNKQRSILQPDTVYLIPPSAEHCEHTENILDSIWIGLQGCKLPATGNEILLLRDEKLGKKIVSLWRTANQRHGHIGSELDGMITVILSKFFRLAGQQKNSESHSIQIAIKYLQDNFSEPIIFSDVATEAGYSEGHFYRLFKQLTGESPSHFLTSIRIRHACNLLNHTNFSLAEITKSSGFNDQFYFSRIFKKWLGMSPSHFRKQTSTPE
jgi:AraC-like DNA-binding protein